MTAPRFYIRELRFGERELELRLPFKFGVTRLEQATQVFIRVLVGGEDGREAWGESAELMVPKWFDKSPTLTNRQNIDQLRTALRLSADAYRSVPRPMTAFGHSSAHAQELLSAGHAQGLPALVCSFGAAELDKAILDGICRVLGISFQQAIKKNLVGLDLPLLAPDLAGCDSTRFLDRLQPQFDVQVRHTVGMLDPLSDEDRDPDQRIDDGLPETLEQVIQAYGHRYFKIKLAGDATQDRARLTAIAEVLDRHLTDYRVTLDGNEQFVHVDGVLEFWSIAQADPRLKKLVARTLFIEQPIHRDQAMTEDVQALAREIPVIIDESDATLDAFPLARGLGYTGVSSKACKGLYKSIINSARCVQAGGRRNGQGIFLSAEDLTCQPGLALQQDLALISLLGIGHVERNGHHYVSGMAGAPKREQQAFLEAHHDLYRSVGGRTTLAIEDGRIRMSSLNCPGFASRVHPDWAAMSEMRLSTEG